MATRCRRAASGPLTREAVEQWLEVADLEETTRDRYEDTVITMREVP